MLVMDSKDAFGFPKPLTFSNFSSLNTPSWSLFAVFCYRELLPSLPFSRNLEVKNLTVST